METTKIFINQSIKSGLYNQFPALIGLLLLKKIDHVFLIAVIVRVIIPTVSIFLVFKYDFSSGPAAVVTSFILFLIIYGHKKTME